MTSPRSGYSSHFGLQNLPFGVASSQANPTPTCVSRYEDTVIWLGKLRDLEGVEGLPKDVFNQSTLNIFAACPEAVHIEVRNRLRKAIEDNSLPQGASEPIANVNMHLPVAVGDFTDFSCSSDHVQNASEAMTGTRSTPPAFYHFPIGYAGRCSSLDVSGTDVERPLGQHWAGKPGQSEVVFESTKRMDFELELACVIGTPLPRREKVVASQAETHIFGYCLLNDWSARDIQGLEMNPLGPLNGKNAATTLSPWIVTKDALRPFQAASPARERPVTAYLDSTNGAYDIKLQVEVSAPGKDQSAVVCCSNSSWMYWTLAQCVAHQAIGGCGLRTGDILATGTVSGQGDEEHGCLMEHMKAGNTPPRGYLEDNETVTLSAFCGEGVGFGECVATLVSARDL